jgi:hypothetical protein
MSFAIRSMIAVAAVFTVVAPVSAQDSALADPGQQPPAASVGGNAALFEGPTARSAALMAPFTLATFEAAPSAALLRQRASHDVALMIVGGAGLIVGSVIGGDAGTLIMVGSGVIGLVGLYRYLQ